MNSRIFKIFGIILSCYIAVLYAGVMLDHGLTTLNRFERVEPTGVEALFIHASRVLQYPFALITDVPAHVRLMLNVANGLIWSLAIFLSGAIAWRLYRAGRQRHSRGDADD